MIAATSTYPGVRCQGGNHDDPHRVLVGEDPVRLVVVSLADGRQPTKGSTFTGSVHRFKAAGTPAREWCRVSPVSPCLLIGENRRCYGDHVERRGSGLPASWWLQIQVATPAPADEPDAAFAGLTFCASGPTPSSVCSSTSSPDAPQGPCGICAAVSLLEVLLLADAATAPTLRMRFVRSGVHVGRILKGAKASRITRSCNPHQVRVGHQRPGPRGCSGSPFRRP